MWFSGVIPEDEPDPRLELREQAKAMPVPILGLVAQPHLEDCDLLGIESGTTGGTVDRMSVGLGYTFWRNPADHDDPANLAELDERTRRAIETPPPWPRPAWLVDAAERMRYPLLWEAVHTTWYNPRSGADRPGVESELAHHVNHVLMNRYSASPPGGAVPALRPDSPVDERHAEHGIPILVNGSAVTGIRIDTDPFVLGLGADLGDAGILTAVLDRDAVPRLTLEFATRPL